MCRVLHFAMVQAMLDSSDRCNLHKLPFPVQLQGYVCRIWQKSLGQHALAAPRPLSGIATHPTVLLKPCQVQSCSFLVFEAHIFLPRRKLVGLVMPEMFHFSLFQTC